MAALLIGIFVTDMIKYGIWFMAIQGLRIRRPYVGGIAAGIFVLLTAAEVINLDTLLLVFNIAVVLLYGVMFECGKGKRGLHIIQALFVMICADEVISGVIRLVQKADWYTPVELKKNYLICNVIIIIIFCIWILAKRKATVLESKKNGKFYRWGIYYINVFMGVLLLFTVSGFQFFGKYVENERIIPFLKLISIISYICIACLLIVMVYIFKVNERYKIYLEKDILLLETQKKMYQAMLAKNEETSRFRHDMQNHLMCLSELAAHKDLGKVQEYIEGMEGNLQSVQNKVYIAGNTVIDVVLNYYISMLKEGVKVSITGKCASNIKMSDVELCTVISNLIQNAEEALNKSESENCYLKVDFQNSKGYMQMQIRNSIPEDSIALDNKTRIPKTTKEDREEHGIGMRNAKETVERNGGIFKVDSENGEFAVFVMIPLDEKADSDR